MTDWDEEEERKRSVKFVDNVIPDTRAQLKVLSKAYQVSFEFRSRLPVTETTT